MSMNITRRGFVKNGVTLFVTGVTLPSLLFSETGISQAAEPGAVQDNENLLQRGAIFDGSSFEGKVDVAKNIIDTAHYFDTVSDGDSSTGWMPMEEKGPHWLEMRWRYPVRINGLQLLSRNVQNARIDYWQNNQFTSLAEFTESGATVQFPEITTDRLRLEITQYSGKPIIHELLVQGPQQVNVPRELPAAISKEEKFVTGQIQLNQTNFKPGETVEVSVEISAATPIQNDCIFIVEIRETAPNNYFREGFGDHELVGVVVEPGTTTSSWPVNQKQNITASFTLPYFAPSGKTHISIMALTVDGKRFIPVENNNTKTNTLATIEIVRDDKAVTVEEFPQTTLNDINGQRGFQVGSKFEMPFMNRYMCSSGFERYLDSKANGIDIQYFLMYSACLRTRDQWQDFITRLDQQISSVLRLRPECYFMVGMDLRVAKDWLLEHPTERMQDRNGKVVIEKISPNGLVSYGSQKYLQDCYDFIDQTINFIKSKPYAGRVIGYYPYACSQNDAFIGGVDNNRMISERTNILLGDFHPGAIELYRQWLHKKYTHISSLQKSWNDPKVTFENAMPAAMDLAAQDFPSGVFRDPVKSRAAIDYIEFFPTLIGGFYQKLAAHYKKRTDNKALVFMNYGAVLATLPIMQASGARMHVNNNDFHNLLQDKNIDMFVQSMPYDKRNADDPIVIYQPIESINCNGKLYMADYDARTVSSGTLRYGRHRSQYESKAIIQRDLSWLMLKNSGAWLADMSMVGWRKWDEYRKPWFSTPATTGPTREVIELFQNSTNLPKKSVTEIAVVVDLETPAYEDILNAGVIYSNLIARFARTELTHLGAPYDLVLKNDLVAGKLRDDYKLYIFVNPFYLKEEERVAIEKLKRDGKTLMWFYAPGYVSDSGNNVKAISRLTGFETRVKENVTEKLQMDVGNIKHPLTNELEKSSFAAVISPSIKHIHPEEVNPVFYVDDPQAQILARYADGKAAWVTRDFGNWKSIYCAVPYLNTQAIRNVAKYAGVHLYCEENIVLGVDNRFLMLTNGYAQQRTVSIALPTPKTVRDAFTGEIISEGRKAFRLVMDMPETRILRLE